MFSSFGLDWKGTHFSLQSEICHLNKALDFTPTACSYFTLIGCFLSWQQPITDTIRICAGGVVNLSSLLLDCHLERVTIALTNLVFFFEEKLLGVIVQ